MAGGGGESLELLGGGGGGGVYIYWPETFRSFVRPALNSADRPGDFINSLRSVPGGAAVGPAETHNDYIPRLVPVTSMHSLYIYIYGFS